MLNGAEVFSKLRTRRIERDSKSHEMRCSVECSPFPSEKIAHGGDRKVHHVVHAAGVDSIDHRTPFITLTPMGIESGKVQGGVT